MNRGYLVPCSPYLYLVPDSGGSPGMDCLPLQRSPGPFHYLIHEQAKSLVALQELQNEVGALLEFRDLVMETFPHLRNKMAPMTSPLPSSIPVPRGSREWEPGVRVRRKLAKEQQQDSSSLVARNRPGKQHQQQHQPKSGGDTSGTSSAGSSAVQDSGFSTETSSSSKDPSHTSSTTSATPVAAPRLGSPKSVVAAPTPQGVPSALNEAEDELWNLLDVIHRKGTRLRDEVEHLQQRMQVSEQREVRRRSLDGSDLQHHDHHHQPDQRPGSRRGLLGGDRRCDSLDEEEIRGLRRERDLLLDKVAEMEAETLASRMKTSELQSELRSLVAAKRDLEEQLRATVSQKSELNSRIHDLHLQFVTSKQVPGSNNNPSDQTPGTGRGLGFSPMRRLSDERKQLQRSTQTSPARSPTLRSDPDAGVGTRSPRGGVSVKKPLGTLNRIVGESVPDSGSVFAKNTLRTQSGEIPLATSVNIGILDGADLALAIVKKPLGALDGIVSSPSCLRRNSRGVVPDPQKMSAILQEFNPVELQRHLITTVVDKQALEKRLEKTEQSQADLADQLDKVKDENEDLRFQLEEKSIELEGTRARVRVLERIQYRAASEEEDLLPMIPPEASTNLVIPLLALPMPIDDIASTTHDDTVHHSSSTESAHDHTDTVETKKAPEPPLSPRRRPSKIPLPPSSKGTKPPTGRTGTPSRCRPDSSNSVSLNSGNKSSNKSKTDSLKTRNNSLSGVGSRTRDSLSAGGKSSLGKQRSNSDSLSSSSRPSLSSNKSLKGSLSSVSGRKTPHHQAARRAGNVTANTRGGLIEPDEQGSKEDTAYSLVTKPSRCENTIEQPEESFSDSLDLEQPQAFTPTTNIVTLSRSEPTCIYHTLDTTGAFMMNSSSSEYFDSINNSETLNDCSTQHLCPYYHEQGFHSSSKHEGLAECDSLENGQVFSNESNAARKLWMTSEFPIKDW